MQRVNMHLGASGLKDEKEKEQFDVENSVHRFDWTLSTESIALSALSLGVIILVRGKNECL